MDVTFLREEEIWGDSALEVIKAYGTKVGVSDAAIALGTCMGSDTKDVAGVASGYAWSASSNENEDVRTVNLSGSKYIHNPYCREAAGRPAMPASVTSAIYPNNVRFERLANGKAVQICEYGAYPQTVVPKDISQELEVQYRKNILKKIIGETYTFDSAELNAWNTGFTPREYAVYWFKGKKYVRIEGKPCDNNSIMSDGTSVQKGVAYWFEVQPIEWLMDPKGTWVSRQALFAGIQFDTRDFYDGNFADTAMYNYLQKHFAKEMQNQFTETLSRLAIHNRYFGNYVSGFGNNKEFYPAGKDGQPFTPEKACDIVNITNAPPFMRDLLKLIATFSKEEQGQFKDVVLTVFDKGRDWRDQPNEIVVLGKKLAVAGGYETELNEVLAGKPLRKVMDEAVRPAAGGQGKGSGGLGGPAFGAGRKKSDGR